MEKKETKTKTGKIVKCKFLRDWQNSEGKTYYYHEITFEGDETTHQVGSISKYPEHLSEGKTIKYYYDDVAKRIKVISEKKKVYRQDAPAATGSPDPNKTKLRTSKMRNKPEPFLGFIFSYSKEMVIAGKTSHRDMEDLINIAQHMYKHLNFMLNTDPETLSTVYDSAVKSISEEKPLDLPPYSGASEQIVQQSERPQRKKPRPIK